MCLCAYDVCASWVDAETDLAVFVLRVTTLFCIQWRSGSARGKGDRPDVLENVMFLPPCSTRSAVPALAGVLSSSQVAKTSGS